VEEEVVGMDAAEGRSEKLCDAKVISMRIAGALVFDQN
jgi:hypothetical protein